MNASINSNTLKTKIVYQLGWTLNGFPHAELCDVVLVANVTEQGAISTYLRTHSLAHNQTLSCKQVGLELNDQVKNCLLLLEDKPVGSLRPAEHQYVNLKDYNNKDLKRLPVYHARKNHYYCPREIGHCLRDKLYLVGKYVPVYARIS
jgi:hypothetical protein